MGWAKCENGQALRWGWSCGWFINLLFIYSHREKRNVGGVGGWGVQQQQEHIAKQIASGQTVLMFCSLWETYVSNTRLLPLIGYLFCFFFFFFESPPLHWQFYFAQSASAGFTPVSVWTAVTVFKCLMMRSLWHLIVWKWEVRKAVGLEKNRVKVRWSRTKTQTNPWNQLHRYMFTDVMLEWQTC